MRPPLIRPANGSTVQRSRSTPTTSSWPASRSGFSVGFAARRRAMKWALPAVGVGTISVSKPSGASRAFSNSAICASLPGGLDVLVWISCCSSATTSPSGPSSCAFAAPGRSTAPARNVTSTPANFFERMCPRLPTWSSRPRLPPGRAGRNGSHHPSGYLKDGRAASDDNLNALRPRCSDADRAPHGALAAARHRRDRVRRGLPGARGLDGRAAGRAGPARAVGAARDAAVGARGDRGRRALEARARLTRPRLRGPHAVGLAAAPARRAPARGTPRRCSAAGPRASASRH